MTTKKTKRRWRRLKSRWRRKEKRNARSLVGSEMVSLRDIYFVELLRHIGPLDPT